MGCLKYFGYDIWGLGLSIFLWCLMGRKIIVRFGVWNSALGRHAGLSTETLHTEQIVELGLLVCLALE